MLNAEEENGERAPDALEVRREENEKPDEDERRDPRNEEDERREDDRDDVLRERKRELGIFFFAKPKQLSRSNLTIVNVLTILHCINPSSYRR